MYFVLCYYILLFYHYYQDPTPNQSIYCELPYITLIYSGWTILLVIICKVIMKERTDKGNAPKQSMSFAPMENILLIKKKGGGGGFLSFQKVNLHHLMFWPSYSPVQDKEYLFCITEFVGWKYLVTCSPFKIRSAVCNPSQPSYFGKSVERSENGKGRSRWCIGYSQGFLFSNIKDRRDFSFDLAFEKRVLTRIPAFSYQFPKFYCFIVQSEDHRIIIKWKNYS